MTNFLFQILFLDAARDFIESVPESARNKIFFNIRKIQSGIKDHELFKKLENSDIWEFRTLYKGIAYRLFAFWDNEEQSFVVATHGIIKKTHKTPPKEITRAEEIRKKYFESKHKS